MSAHAIPQLPQSGVDLRPSPCQSWVNARTGSERKDRFRMESLTSLRIAAAILLSLSTAAWAGNSISVGTVTANVGDSVTIPILIDTDQPMNVLRVDIMTDAALCGMMESEAIVKGPAANAPLQEGGEMCPTARVVFLDLSGNAAVGAGSGVLAAWTFNVRLDAVGGVFPLRLTVVQASNGPRPVSLAPGSGTLTLVPQGGRPAIGAAPPPAPAADAPAEPQVGAPVEPGAQPAPAGWAPVGAGGAAKGAAAGGSAVTGANPPGVPPPEGGEEPVGGVAAPGAAEPAGQVSPGSPTAIRPTAAVTPQTPAAPAAATPATAPSPASTNTVASRPPTPTRTAAATATQAARTGSCAMTAGADRQRRGAILLIPLLVLGSRRLRARTRR
jgi:hypothetical protein